MTLKEVRLARGMSQVKLGIKAKVPSAAISDVERGVRKPWPKMARSLARALGVSVDDLFGEAEDDGER